MTFGDYTYWGRFEDFVVQVLSQSRYAGSFILGDQSLYLVLELGKPFKAAVTVRVIGPVARPH